MAKFHRADNILWLILRGVEKTITTAAFLVVLLIMKQFAKNLNKGSRFKHKDAQRPS